MNIATCWALASIPCLTALSSAAEPADYMVETFRGGQLVHQRPTSRVEFQNSAKALIQFSSDRTVSHVQQVDMARALDARSRCFNLYATRMAAGGVALGKIDANANAEDFLKESAATLEDVNKKTGVSCGLRVVGAPR